MTKVEADWLTRENTRAVMDLFEGAEAYFVGGCVRNTLINAPVSDLDIATNLLPEDVLARAEKAGLKAVPTGLEHGTITVVSEGEPFEITTYRKDIETHGRHATVQFSDKIEEDAARRDFTMNALYADRDGNLVDPLHGLDDLKARRVCFIHDAQERVREDYLRILRFFRFHAWYGDDSAGLDAEALAACADGLDGLTGISKERVGSEMIKLLTAPEPSMAVAAMAQTGVLQTLLPGADPRFFLILTDVELDVDPIARLVALGGSGAKEGLRLSKVQMRKYTKIKDFVGSPAGLSEIAFKEGTEMARAVAGCRAAFFEQPVPALSLEEIEFGSNAQFPVSAQDLMPEFSGGALGQALRVIERLWIAGGMSAQKAELLDRFRKEH